MIETLHVANAHVRYENRADQIDLALPVTSHRRQGTCAHRRHTLRLHAAHGRVVMQDRKAALDSLEGEFDIGADDVRVTRVRSSRPKAHAFV